MLSDKRKVKSRQEKKWLSKAMHLMSYFYLFILILGDELFSKVVL